MGKKYTFYGTAVTCQTVHSKSKCNKQPRFSWSLIYEKHHGFASRPGRVTPKSDTSNTKGLYMTKRNLISLVIPLFTIVLGKKLFNDKKSAFIADPIAPLRKVRRIVIIVGIVKTVNAIL